VSETAQAFAWVDATMRADSSLMAAAVGGVHQGFADIGTVPPFVSYGRQSGSDVTTVNQIRLFVHILLQIKAVGPIANYAALVVIADRIDALFKDKRNIGLASGGILACYRDSELAYDDPPVNGAAWANLGGLYHIELQGV